jgi:hypothetical protein
MGTGLFVAEQTVADNSLKNKCRMAKTLQSFVVENICASPTVFVESNSEK